MLIETPESHYDLVVVGGGMVGASFACALCKAVENNSLSILIVEAVPLSVNLSQQPSFDARSTALSHGSHRIYEQMGLWSQLAGRVTPIKEIHVSDRGRFGSTHLVHSEHNVEALGYVVENQWLGEVLNEAMAASARINLLAPAKVNQASPLATGMQLQIESGGNNFSVDTSLLVLADGGKSPICSQLGIEQSISDYQQHALIANIAFEKPHNNVAFERFTDTGPLAVLPLGSFESENRGSLVWTVSAGQSADLLALEPGALLELLMERFGNRLGRITHTGERFCYPLTLSVAKEQIRPGLVLLGNVAHTLHPVAGQGLNLALRDTAVLVERLQLANERGGPLGDMAVLQDYLDNQDFDQRRTIRFTDQLTRLFSSNRQVSVVARKLGLLSIDLMPSIKHEFAEQAMGLGAK
ncbi:MAG: 2-octaprenyl-6-methoxyphenyl hydroxylase [Proteobacteria bacterium]|nr:2-octaprenyl-6-methoxyphenyl hydroxylase [Pseudomonadota bacterium]